MIDDALLKAEVSRLLDDLYSRRFAVLEKLTLTVLLSKNPYLYRSLGVTKHADLIEQLLAARVSSSDETLFGNCFLEPLALWAASNANAHDDPSRKAYVGGGAGFDVAIETDTCYLAIAVKSGKNIFNSQSTKGQNAEFDGLQARVMKMKKQFRKVIGYGYGRKTVTKETSTEKVAGQAFWKLLTEEEDFYLRITRVIGTLATEHAIAYKEAYDKKSNLLVMDCMHNFMDSDGGVAWDKVTEFNSGSGKRARLLSYGAVTKPKAVKAKRAKDLAVEPVA